MKVEAAEGSPGVHESSSDPPSAASNPQPVQGRIRYFGDYELLEEIARGGMGVVYKARQVSLNRLVAVKMILSGEFASEEFVQRFRKEAEAAANLHHPNIVAIHEVGMHEGQHYFSMDYVAGKNLADLVREGPLPARRAAGYLRTIAEAIHYAHERGILHRDLKPSNVLIDVNDQPRITDFGLAKRLVNSESGTQNPELTLTGQVLGSPNYISPEQATGRRGAGNRTSDVYSLGAILFYLLTGRAPFVAETVADTLQQVVHSEAVSPRLLNPAAPRDLETICLKCLNKEPRRRYATAQELADELGRLLRDEPILARPVGRTEKAWRWCRRNRTLASFVGATMLLLLAVTIGSPIAIFRINRARLQAQAKESEAKERLRDSYLDQARANRWSGRAGRRFDSLDVLKRAANIRPSLDLRNEAIACMALTDLRPIGTNAAAEQDFVVFDCPYERYARSDNLGNLTVCRVSDDKELVRLPGFGQRVYGLLRFSPNGRFLVARYSAKTVSLTPVWVWDVERQSVILKDLPARGEILNCDFSPDSRWIAFARSKGPPLLYDLASGTATNAFGRHHGSSTIRFHPKGGKLAIVPFADGSDASRSNNIVEIWDMTSGSVTTLPHPEAVKSVAWHPDGELLATACADSHVRVWDINTLRPISDLRGHQSVVLEVHFNHRGDRLFTFGNDATLRLWDWLEEQLLVRQEARWSYNSVSTDDRRLACGLPDGKRVVLEIADSREHQMIHIPDNSPYRGSGGTSYIQAGSTTVESNGLFATVHGDGVRLWNMTTAMPIALVPGRGFDAAVMHPSGKTLFAAVGGHLTSWPILSATEDGAIGVKIGSPEEWPNWGWNPPIGLSRDGGTLAAIFKTNLVVLDTESRVEKNRFPALGSNLAMAMSPDGRWLAQGNFIDPAQIRDLKTGELILSLPRDTLPGNLHLLFSPDSNWLVIGTMSQCHVWDTRKWSLAYSIPKERGGGNPAVSAFAPDGRILAVAVTKTVVRLVDIASGQEIASLESPSMRLPSALVFAHDGSRLGVVCNASRLELWHLGLVRRQLAAMGLDWETSGGL